MDLIPINGNGPTEEDVAWEKLYPVAHRRTRQFVRALITNFGTRRAAGACRNREQTVSWSAIPDWTTPHSSDPAESDPNALKADPRRTRYATQSSLSLRQACVAGAEANARGFYCGDVPVRGGD